MSLRLPAVPPPQGRYTHQDSNGRRVSRNSSRREVLEGVDLDDLLPHGVGRESQNLIHVRDDDYQYGRRPPSTLERFCGCTTENARDRGKRSRLIFQVFFATLCATTILLATIAAVVLPNLLPPPTPSRNDTTSLGELTLSVDDFFRQAEPVALSELERVLSARGTILGSVLSSQIGVCPKYDYVNSRDQVLAYHALVGIYEHTDSSTTQKDIVKHMERFAEFLEIIHEENVNQQTFGGRSWSVADARHDPTSGIMYKGPWCSPQSYVVALRVTTFLRFIARQRQLLGNDASLEWVSRVLYSTDSSKSLPLNRDLQYLLTVTTLDTDCDFWGAVTGSHFYSLAMAWEALQLAAEFARSVGKTGDPYVLLANELRLLLGDHWDPNERTLRASVVYTSQGESAFTGRESDSQVLLALSHVLDTFLVGESFSPVNPIGTEAMLSVLDIWKSNEIVFDINNLGWNSEPQLGVAIGRYAGDQYNGFCVYDERICPPPCRGQAWFATTFASAEYLYKVASYYRAERNITISRDQLPFFQYMGGVTKLFEPLPNGENSITFEENTPEFQSLMLTFMHTADSFVRRIQYHTNSNFQLDEQFNGVTGFRMSAGVFTWSYVSLLTAKLARDKLQAEQFFVELTPAASVLVHVVITKVPLDVLAISIVAGTQAACDGTPAFVRRQVNGFNEWSAVVSLPRNQLVTLRAKKHDENDCASGVGGPRSETLGVQVKTGTRSFSTPVYENWCEQLGCAQPKDEVVIIRVVGVPGKFASIVLTGDQETLGNWDPCAGQRAEYIRNNGPETEWAVNVTVPTNREVFFKAVGLTDPSRCAIVDGAEYEPGTKNSFLSTFADEKRSIVNVWGCGNCAVTKKPTLQPTPSPVAPVNIELIITNVPSYFQGGSDKLHFVGSVPALGDWDPCTRPLLASNSGAGEWRATVALPVGERIEFKAALLFQDVCVAPNLQWEPNGNNVFTVPPNDSNYYANWSG